MRILGKLACQHLYILTVMLTVDLGPSQAPAPPLTAPTRVSNRKKRPLASRGFLQIEKRPFQSKVMAPESLRILKFANIGELPGGTL